ncbi:hypothetical protein POM88_052770 [Heracleum sosnowskyi]|uniref:Uncharacterized protein n=1 Tax=Heracleum sosnowskyi TaxID=360622 RepID=A0AAD8GRA9_9APIA|nr:hypothetical protein POM88_052770 [Heracleum sosnowskyi]
MYAALLMEEFPLDLLTDKVKSVAKEKIITEYFGFADRFANDSLRVGVSGVLYTHVSALSAALQSLQVRISDTDMKTLKLLVVVINKYRDSKGKVKDSYRELLSETLGIISIIKHLYESDEMEGTIIELKNLFIFEQTVSDDRLSLCKPNLAIFMAGFSHIKLSEDDESSKSVAAEVNGTSLNELLELLYLSQLNPFQGEQMFSACIAGRRFLILNFLKDPEKRRKMIILLS